MLINDPKAIYKARKFALEAHGNQEHGCLTMEDHLNAVTNKIFYEYYRTNRTPEFSVEDALSVGWLHDTIEDTNVSYKDLVDNFGLLIADGVQGVTDSEGKNRTERHLNTYHRTRKNALSTFVKLADRWHNQKRSLENKERFASMYAKEYLYFKFALYEPGMYDSFWQQLDEQYAELKKI